jgi:hypothetical protein
MQIAIPLFDRFTALDAIGPHQVLVCLPGSHLIFLAERTRGVCDESGSVVLQAEADMALALDQQVHPLGSASPGRAAV